MNKILRPSVGADLSALAGCSDIRIILLKFFHCFWDKWFSAQDLLLEVETPHQEISGMRIKDRIPILCRSRYFGVWPGWSSVYISEEKWSLYFDIAN